MTEDKKIFGWVSVGLLLLTLVGVSMCAFEQVEEGTRGVKKTWGKVDEKALTPGVYFFNPFSTDVIEMDVKEVKFEDQTECFTKDTQVVKVSFAASYYPDPSKIGQLYSQFGRDWDKKIVSPAVLGSLKDAIGQYIADDLVSTREKVKAVAQQEIKDALAQRSVILTRLDLINLDFDDAYEKAVEAKVVAIQRAQEAKNKSVQVEEESKQKVKMAEAEAESMRIRSQALQQNKGLVEYEKVQKWDGHLPKIIMGGGSVPMLDLKGVLE